MKIWIFEPGPNWDYCGGMAYAVAESYDRAIAVLKDAFIKDCGKDNKPQFYAAPQYIPEGSRWDVWLLIDSYEVVNATERAHVSYNYA